METIDLEHTLDPSMMGTISWVNDSGKSCKVTFGSKGEASTMDLTIQLPEGPEPQGPVKTKAPFAIHKITLERDGKKVASDLKLDVRPGETYEIHVGPDDKLEAVLKSSATKPAP